MPRHEDLKDFIVRTWDNREIPGAWDPTTEEQVGRTLAQLGEVVSLFKYDFTGIVRAGFPDYSPKRVRENVNHVTHKTAAFGPALAQGSIEDTSLLLGFARALADMYACDQTMDHGDNKMALALEYTYGGQQPELLAVPYVPDRLKIVHDIPRQIGRFALKEDQPYVQDCYEGQVLANELLVYQLSRQYAAMEDDDSRNDFLLEHGSLIAETLTTNAGVPSVVYSLYAAYRTHRSDLELADLATIHTNPSIASIIKVGNASCRLVDDAGDKEEDKGTTRGGNIFTLNLINQAHPAILEPFLDNAEIPREERRGFMRSVETYRDGSVSARQYGEAIRWLLVGNTHQKFARLSEDVTREHAMFIKYLKRVLVIGIGKDFNAIGDIELAAPPEN